MVAGSCLVATQDLQTIRALSRYRPFEAGGASVKEAHEDLVLAALAEANGRCESVAECRDVVQTLFRIKLSDLLVANALNSLIKDERVVKDGGCFALAPGEAKRLAEVAADSEKTAADALAEWHGRLAEKWPLTSDDLQVLTGQLAVYLKTVLRRHGAEASMLLYPDADEAQHLYAELEQEGFDFLPTIAPELREVRDFGLSDFIRNPTESQRLFLGQNLNTAYFLTVLSIDPEGARLVSEIAAGQVVYLDTNFIYRLLGVQGPRYVRPAEEILRATQATGYTCRITPWTLDEFRTSLQRSRNFIDRFPILPDQYADIAAAGTSDQNFVTEYWRRVRSGIKPGDFFSYYDEVETHLKERSIEVSSEGVTAVEQREDDITDEMAVLARAAHGRYRHPALLEHDVKHRLLVKRLRGTGSRSFSNAGYWFITHDSVLPRYDHLAAEGGPSLSFCVSAGAWYQIVEAFRPKTEDMDQTLSDLLASPYVRYRRTLSQKNAIQIVARVDQFEGGTPELATRVFMNSAALAEIETAESDEEVIEKIDNAIIAAAHEAQEDARRAREIAEQERHRADEIAAKAQERANEAERQAALAREVAEAAKNDEIERTRLRAAEELRLAEERADRERDARERRHEEDIANRNQELQRALKSGRDARRRLFFFGAAVAIVVLFFLVKGVLGIAAAWSALVAVGVVLGLGIGVAQWARWHSDA